MSGLCKHTEEPRYSCNPFVNSGPVLTGTENLTPTGIRFPDRPARSGPAMPTATSSIQTDFNLQRVNARRLWLDLQKKPGWAASTIVNAGSDLSVTVQRRTESWRRHETRRHTFTNHAVIPRHRSGGELYAQPGLPPQKVASVMADW